MNYVVGAYTVVWALLFLYVWSLARRQREVEAELDGMRQLLRSREEGSSDPFTKG